MSLRAAIGWAPTWGAVVGVVVVGAALVAGAGRLDDNSFLTHLATGRLILDEGRVPSADPYSFTAAGEPWVVQSWLASVVYAAAERIGGGDAIRVVVAATSAVIAALTWRLTRPAGGVVARLVLATVTLVVGFGLWAERPFLFGLVGLALTLLALEGGLSPRWLVVVGWVWTNTHGSFPLGVVAAVAFAAGRWLDEREAGHELRVAAWLTGGVVAGVIGPLGLRAVTFPVDLLGRYDVLSGIVEWRAPEYESLSQRAFLGLVAAFVVALVRRPSWRRALPGLLFTLAAVVSLRNVVVAGLVLVTVSAPAFAGLGSLSSSARLRAGRLAVAVVAAATVVGVGARLGAPAYRLGGNYPVTALAWLHQHDVDLASTRLVTHDRVGNLLTLLEGPVGAVYYDDRFDMYPVEISEGYRRLAAGRPGWSEVLDELEADLVVWDRASATAQLLAADDGWRVLLVDEGYVLACRRDAPEGRAGCPPLR